jgi:hypothetical protein
MVLFLFMHNPENNNLVITDILQLETALTALEATGLSAEGRKFFEVVKHLKEATTILGLESGGQDKIRICIQGGIGTFAIRADLIMGLELLSSNDQVPEKKVAAQALLEILTNKT